jgi:hypothetical protein
MDNCLLIELLGEQEETAASGFTIPDTARD